MSPPRIGTFVAGLVASCAALACAPDTKPDTEIIQPSCDSLSCDDGDACTDDLCKVDGTCIHVPRNPAGACQTAAHCDDGDPCTDDSCALDDCGLMRCLNDRRPDCTSCDPGCASGNCGFAPCDDGDPCTPNLCGADGICQSLAADPNCDPNCREANVQSVEAAQFGVYDGYVTTWVGRVQAATRSCDQGACTCESDVQLADQGFGFRVVDASEGAPSWTCAVAACDVTSVACDPLLDGVGYVAWGTVRYVEPHAARSPPAQADTMVPMSPPIDRFDVEGWCLSTRVDFLPGAYTATFDLQGQAATFDLELSLTDTMSVTGLMGACTGCAAVALVEDQAIAFGYEPDSLPITLTTTSGSIDGRLYAKKDRFVGDLAADGHYAGHLEVERLAR